MATNKRKPIEQFYNNYTLHFSKHMLEKQRRTIKSMLLAKRKKEKVRIGRTKMNNNHLFQERLTQAIKLSGKSTNQIERDLGYPRNALHNYRKGSEPSATRLMELSQYFQLPPGYLMGVIPNHVPNDPRAYFEQLNEEQKVEMLKVCHKWSEKRIENMKYLN